MKLWMASRNEHGVKDSKLTFLILMGLSSHHSYQEEWNNHQILPIYHLSIYPSIYLLSISMLSFAEFSSLDSRKLTAIMM